MQNEKQAAPAGVQGRSQCQGMCRNDRDRVDGCAVTQLGLKDEGFVWNFQGKPPSVQLTYKNQAACVVSQRPAPAITTVSVDFHSCGLGRPICHRCLQVRCAYNSVLRPGWRACSMRAACGPGCFGCETRRCSPLERFTLIHSHTLHASALCKRAVGPCARPGGAEAGCSQLISPQAVQLHAFPANIQPPETYC
jgi:hypothetical protein